jgi:tRNA nucleotidyltransferase (CCA-adding enzyme)
VKKLYLKFPEENIDKSILYLFYLLQFSNLDIKTLTKKIELSKKTVDILNTIEGWKDNIINLLGQKLLFPSNIYYYLQDKPNELLIIILLEKGGDNQITERIENYLKIYKKTSIFISGNDLTNLGMKPGPVYAKILKLILYLQLNKILNNKDEEMTFVKKLLEKRII